MSREILFRAWHGGKMMCQQEIDHRNFADLRESRYVKLMQRTGLLDKNGVKVFEGDIIKYPTYDKPYSHDRKASYEIGEVVFYSGNSSSEDKKNPSRFNTQPTFGVRTISNEKGYNNIDRSCFHDCEVIGNVYENESLLRNETND